MIGIRRLHRLLMPYISAVYNDQENTTHKSAWPYPKHNLQHQKKIVSGMMK